MMLVDIALFMAATLAVAIVAGLAGFAFELVAAAVWLHILTPLQTTTLIVVFGLVRLAAAPRASLGSPLAVPA